MTAAPDPRTPDAAGPTCVCGVELSRHHSSDPPHASVDAEHYYGTVDRTPDAARYNPCNAECNGCPTCDPGLADHQPDAPTREDACACGGIGSGCHCEKEAPTREGLSEVTEKLNNVLLGYYGGLLPKAAHVAVAEVAAEIERIVAARMAASWDECFDDCAEQLADGMNPANRNPYDRGA